MKTIIIFFILTLTCIAQVDYYGVIARKNASDTEAPAAPTILAAVGGTDDQEIVLTWTDPTADDLEKIYVYRDLTDNPTTLVDSVGDGVETYTDGSLVYNQIYYYRLKARDDVYNYSAYTSSVNDTVNYTEQLWYVSNADAGNGSGDSWANAMKYADLHNDVLNAGDTVYIDGGAESLVYVGAGNFGLETKAYSIWADGTASAKIVFTRGIDDPDHDGTPIFRTPLYETSIYFTGANYVELSYVKLDSVLVEYDGIRGGSISAHIEANDCSYIDILHNEIINDGGDGIIQSNTDHGTVMYNTITTGVIENNYNSDALWLGECNDFEIAYNYMVGQNSMLSLGPDTVVHKDIFQIFNHDLDGGTTKIHHNFLAILPDTGYRYQALYFEDVSGNLLIYNNIIVVGKVDGANINLMKSGTSEYPLSVNIYNNTVISEQWNGMVIAFADTLRIKNNILISGIGSSYIINTNSDTDIDYNQYQSSDTSNFAGGKGWWNWVNVSGWDASGGAGETDYISFADIYADSINAYKLVEGSPGIDDGTDLDSIFTTDINDVTRPVGVEWNVGAVEDTVEAGEGSGYDAEAITYFEAVDVAGDAFTEAQEIRINKYLFVDMKDSLGTNDLDETFDFFQVYSNETETAGLLNIVKRSHDATNISETTWTQWEGFTGDGSADRLTTNYNPTEGVVYTLNSASYGVYIRTDNNDGGVDIGAADGSTRAHLGVRYENALGFRLNNDNSINVANTDSRGMFIMSRTASDAVSAYKNGVSLIDDDEASTSVPNNIFEILAVNNFAFSTRQISCAFAGIGLTTTDVRKITNVFEAYMDDLPGGKGVIP